MIEWRNGSRIFPKKRDVEYLRRLMKVASNNIERVV